MKKTTTAWRLLALLFAFVLVANACGSDDDSASSVETASTDDTSSGESDDAEPEVAAEPEASGPEQSDLTVGIIPINDVIPLPAAISDGIFESNGLTVASENAAGGAAIIPGVVAGDFDIGFSNVYSIMKAAESGLDIRIIASGPYVGDEDFSGLLSMDISSVEDLDGTTIAVNTLGNLVELSVRETMANAGADSDTVSFIEIPFPEMVGALEAGQVDAIGTVEPFVGAAQRAGATLLATPFSSSQPNMMVAVWFTTGEFAGANPNTVAAFVTSIDAANEKIQSDRDFANQVLVDSTKTPSLEAAAGTTLPIFKSGVDTGSLETSADLAQKWGVLEGAPDLDALLG